MLTSNVIIRSIYVAAALIALPAAAATIEVRVTKASGAAIENAVVYAIPPKPMALVKHTAVMDQINRQFVPHVLPIQTSTWVEFPNSDQILHQVFSDSPIRRFNSPLYIGKPARPIQFSTAGVAQIGCAIHEEMNAYIVVVNTPYFATTTKAGRVSLANVDAGEYTLHLWYEGMRNEPTPQTVTVGNADVTASFVIQGQ
jgi:plastocyanin